MQNMTKKKKKISQCNNCPKIGFIFLIKKNLYIFFLIIFGWNKSYDMFLTVFMRFMLWLCVYVPQVNMRVILPKAAGMQEVSLLLITSTIKCQTESLRFNMLCVCVIWVLLLWPWHRDSIHWTPGKTHTAAQIH